MTRRRLVVERAVHACVQDLGRPGHASIGVSANGAADQVAARTANTLVGNDETAPLVEVSGSEFVVRCESDTLVAATGAADALLVDGHPRPSWELVPVHRGGSVRLPVPSRGLRSYLAFNGTLATREVLGSVAPDGLLDVGWLLADGDELSLDSAYASTPGEVLPLFRLGAGRPAPPADGIAVIDVTPGPELHRLRHGVTDLDATFEVSADSNHVGLRLEGPPVTLDTNAGILSRGVPIGAVQVPPSGGVIVLLRGRLVTAGYPIVAVTTTVSLDTLGQLRPGDRLRFRPCTTDEAVTRLQALDDDRRALAGRVRTALASRGLARVLAASTPTDVRRPSSP